MIEGSKRQIVRAIPPANLLEPIDTTSFCRLRPRPSEAAEVQSNDQSSLRAPRAPPTWSLRKH